MLARPWLGLAFLALVGGCAREFGVAERGERCVRSTECVIGLACVADRCTDDLSGLEGGTLPPVPVDAGPEPDAGPELDAGPGVDAGPDAGPMDAGSLDAGRPDAGRPDAGPPDAGRDAGPPDAGPPDAGPPDAGLPPTPDAGPMIDGGAT